MNNEYGRIVYTRRQTGYTLDGAPDLKGGHGIFSISSNAASSEKDKDFVDDIIKLRRIGANEEGTEYSYVIPGTGSPMLGKYRNRTVQEEEAAAKVANVDARGTFIMEWLVGVPQKYSFEYFDSPFFAADSLPIAEYYKNEPVPMESGIPADTVPAGPMTRKMVMDFANNGRANAVRQAVAVLLEQLSRPEAERKMIVIRDSEANVRMWIAAILYSFPVSLANKISYDTRRINFNNEPSTCYYVMKATNKYVRMRNLQDPNQERRFYSLIAGAEPSDSSCSSLNNPMPNRPYLVIDGRTNQAAFTVQVPEQAYFRALVTDDKEIESFAGFAAELDNVTFENLSELFDAIRIVSDEGKWEYSALLQSLNVLVPHLTERSVLVNYVLTKMCVEDGYRRLFVSADEKNSLKLFSLLQSIAAQFNIKQVSTMLCDCAAVRVEQFVAAADSKALKHFTGTLKAQSSATYEYAARKTVLTDRFKALDVRSIAQAGPEFATELVDLISSALNSEKKTWSEYAVDPANQKLMDELIRMSLTDEQITGALVGKLSGNAAMVEYYVRRGTELIPNLHTGASWWRTLLKKGVSIDKVCQIIDKAGVPIDEVENLLCAELRDKGYSSGLKSLYNRYLAGKPNIGTRFFQEWFRVIRSKQNNEKEMETFLSEVRTYPHLSQFYVDTVQKLDSEIPFDKKDSAYSVMLKRFLVELRLYESSNTILREYLTAIGSTKTGGLFGKNKDALSKQYEKANPNHYYFRVRQDITNSELFNDFMSVLEDSMEDEYAFSIGLGSFQFTAQNLSRTYTDRFAEMVYEHTIKHKDHGGLGTLMHYFIAYKKTNGANPADLVLTNLSDTLYRIEQLFGEEKTEKLSEKVVTKTGKEYGEETASEVEALFVRAQDYYKKNHKPGFFEKLFGR